MGRGFIKLDLIKLDSVSIVQLLGSTKLTVRVPFSVLGYLVVGRSPYDNRGALTKRDTTLEPRLALIAVAIKMFLRYSRDKSYGCYLSPTTWCSAATSKSLKSR